MPVFTTVRISIPVNKTVYFFHVDPGYGIHRFHYAFLEEVGNGNFQMDFKNTGRFYMGIGAGLHLKRKSSPYINLQYSMYHLKYVTRSTDIGQSKEVSYVNQHSAKSITITVGIRLHAKK